MRSGNHHGIHQHAGFGEHGATSGDAGIHGRNIAGHGAKRFAAHRHREANFEELHVGSFCNRVGNTND